MTSISMIGVFDTKVQGFEIAKAPEPIVKKPETTGDPVKDHVLKLSELAKKIAKEDNPFDAIVDGGTGGASGAEEDKSLHERMIKDLEKKIKRAQEELKELNASDMPPDMKRKLIMQKQAEITQLQSQMAELQKQQQKLGKMPTASSITGSGSLT